MAVVLIVDDDELVRAALILLLERAGYEVLHAVDGASGITLCKERHPDLIVVDIIMPDMEGVEMIIAMRRFARLPKIIAMSGGGWIASRDILKLARRAGADDTFAKPIDNDEFLASVSRLLAS